MICLTVEALHRKVLAIAITSAISASIQSSYAEVPITSLDRNQSENTIPEDNTNNQPDLSSKSNTNETFNKSLWPPEQTKVINTGTTEKIPDFISITPNDKDNTVHNIQLNSGNPDQPTILKNHGIIQGIFSNPNRNKNTLIQSTGNNIEIHNEKPGTISTAFTSGETGAYLGILIKGDNNTVFNKGSIIVNSEGYKHPVSNIGIKAEEKANVVNFESGKIYVSRDDAVGIEAKGGTALNNGVIEIDAAATALKSVADTYDTGNQTVITNEDTIFLKNKNDIGMLSDGQNIEWFGDGKDWDEHSDYFKSGAVNGTQGLIKGEGIGMLSYSSGFIKNQGNIQISGSNSVGARAQSKDAKNPDMDAGLMTNTGTITAIDGANGIHLHKGGLKNSGTIISDSSAIHGTGPFNVAIVMPGSYIKGKKAAVLLEGSGNDINLIELRGGTLQGDLIGNSPMDILRLNPVENLTDQINQKVSINGQIKDFELIYIAGEKWAAYQPVINPKSLVADGTVNFTLSDIRNDQEQTLQLTFADKFPKSNGFDIKVNKAGITNIDLSDTENRPAARISMEGGKLNHITGHQKSNDEVSLESGIVTIIEDVHRIRAKTDGQWQVKEPIRGVKHLVTEAASRNDSEPPAFEQTSVIIRDSAFSAEDFAPDNQAAGSKANTLIVATPSVTEITKGQPIPEFDGSEGKAEVTIANGAQFGQLVSPEKLLIKASADNPFHAYGSVLNTNNVEVSPSGHVQSLSLGSGGSNIDGHLGFLFPKTEPDTPFRIANYGSITEIDASRGNQRPELHYTHSSDSLVKLKGNRERNDIVILKGGSPETVQAVSSSALQNGFTNLHLDGVPAPVELPENLDSLTLTSSAPIGGIYAINTNNLEKGIADKSHEIPNPTFLPYSAGAPKRAVLRTDFVTPTIDFSLKERPDMLFEILDGEIGKLIGNPEKNDQLVIHGGKLKGDVDSIQSVTVSGKDWKANGHFSNIKEIHIDGNGLVTRLQVYGQQDSPQADENDRTLQLVSSRGQRVPINVSKGGALGLLEVHDQASIGDIHMQDGIVHIVPDQNGSWELGRVINAGGVYAPETEFGHVLIGENPLLSPIGKNLVLDTPENLAVSVYGKKVGTLELTNGAKIKGETPAVEQLLVNTSDFSSEGWISAHNLFADAQVEEINISDNSQSKPASNVVSPLSTLNIQTSPSKPLNIHSHHPTPQIGRVNINNGANIGDVDSVKNIWIHGTGWSSQGFVNNPETLTIAADGSADQIIANVTLPSEQGIARGQSLHIHFTNDFPIEKNKAFVVTNLGKTGADELIENRGNLKVLDFSADITRPPLYFIQHGGITDEVKGRQDKGDTLALVNGRLNKVSGFTNIDIGGSNWSSIKLTDPETINILDDTEVASILLSEQVPGGKGILATHFSETFAKDGDNINIHSKGHIGRIELNSNTQRPGFTIEQTGGSLGAVTGLSGKGDSLIATDTQVTEQFSDLDSITFNGSNSYEGNLLHSIGSVVVNGNLHLLADRIAIESAYPSKEDQSGPSPTFHIREGATVTIPSELNITGSYQHDGRLILTERDPDSGRLIPITSEAEHRVPVVTANNIAAGPNAEFVFDSSIINEPAIGKQYLLMEATDSDIHQAVHVDAVDETYIHYEAIVDPNNARRMLLTSTDQSSHSVNQAPSRFRSMVLAATKPTDKGEIDHPKPKSDGARLTQHVAKNIKPGKASINAAELAPSMSPHAIHNANLALKAAGKTLDDRMSGKRTGISTGDIFSAGGAWAQYSYSKATQDLKDNVPGYHAKTNGFSIGADNPLEEDQDIEVGIAYTYSKGKVEGKDGSRNKIDTDTHIFSLYSSYIEDDFFFDGRMSYSFGKNKGHRYVGGNLHDAKYDTQSWGVGMIAGYTYPLGYEWSWQPQMALNYYTMKTDDHTESARDPAQTYLSYDQVNNGKYDIMELGAGLKLIGEINTDSMIIKPELGLMGFHDFKKDPIAITAHFAAGGENFLINGADRDANRYQFDATINMEIESNTTITFSYSHHWADNFKVDGFIARVRYEF